MVIVLLPTVESHGGSSANRTRPVSWSPDPHGLDHAFNPLDRSPSTNEVATGPGRCLSRPPQRRWTGKRRCSWSTAVGSLDPTWS